MTVGERSSGVRLPPGPALPRRVQGAAFLASRRRMTQLMRRRYGRVFSLHVPLFGRAVFVSDPALVKQLFMTSTDIVGNVEPNLGRVLGRGSFFNLEGDEHRRQRKLLVPPFHGKRMQSYESIIEEETLREAATWPQGQPFETLAPMMRITLNAILRAVFGAEGAELDALRALLPPLVTLGSRLALLPGRQVELGRWTPWGRFAAYRRQFDAIVGRLIAKASADPAADDRGDILSLMLQARYDDGGAMSHDDISDQLLTLLAAGHETTATTLAWAVERLRRHPALLARLVAEADAGGSELRQATIIEVQRTRPVIDIAGRTVKADSVRLGEWVIPRGYNILVGISLIHDDEEVFPDAASFNPDRFVGAKPDSYAWIPFGGGTRRCIGAAFANMEMNVVLRTLLRDFELSSTYEPPERWHSRGVAYAPAKGGVAIVHRRPAHDSSSHDSAMPDMALRNTTVRDSTGTAQPSGDAPAQVPA
jgi:cytochrome P450